MKYNNLLNKIVVMFACGFFITMASNHTCSAEDLPEVPTVENANPETADVADDDVLNLDDIVDEQDNTAPVQDAVEPNLPTPEAVEPEVPAQDVDLEQPAADVTEGAPEDDFLNT